MAAKVKLNRLDKLKANGIVPAEDLEQAQIELQAAEAQVMIRQAEMKEIAVKLNYARKRLEEAKNPPPPAVRPAGPNPFRANPANPKPVDPSP